LKTQTDINIPVGTRALMLSKLYYGVISKSLENLDIERYYSILYFLNENDGCSQQHICNNLAIDKTAMVKVIDYLIRSGYIARKVNPQDRREHFITLTKKGRVHTREIVAAFNALDREMFSSVSKSDRAAFIKVIALLSEKLKTLPGNEIFFNYKKTAGTGKKKEAALPGKTKSKRVSRTP
jgi:DNA-binding MarR family transcriptional regulator